MDKRSSLPEGANLSFPGNMECTVLAEEGRDVFEFGGSGYV